MTFPRMLAPESTTAGTWGREHRKAREVAQPATIGWASRPLAGLPHGGEMENFKFFALQYLNEWYLDDKRFVVAFKSKNRAVRLRYILKAAKYYGVIRTFKNIQERRLDTALQALDAVSAPVTDANVDSTVCNLEKTLQEIYGGSKISAASKFLWIRFQAPVVIYDDNAYQFLRKRFVGQFKKRDYPNYRRKWLTQFDGQENCIHSACDGLVEVKAFSLAHGDTDENIKCIVGTRWFRERVFDKYLLWNAGR